VVVGAAVVVVGAAVVVVVRAIRVVVVGGSVVLVTAAAGRVVVVTGRVVVVEATWCLRLSWATSWGLQTGAPMARPLSIGWAARTAWLRTATTAVATVGAGPPSLPGDAPDTTESTTEFAMTASATTATPPPTSARRRRTGIGPTKKSRARDTRGVPRASASRVAFA